MKLHLTAKVPNEGARLVAQWVLGLPRGLIDARAQLGTDEDRVQRIISGDMVPGMDVGRRLAVRAGVRARDFNRKPVGGWFDRPAAA
jgi:hypothetical protein